MTLHNQAFNCLLLLLATSAFTSSAHADKASTLAKQSQNPISTLISLPFENNGPCRSGAASAGSFTGASRRSICGQRRMAT